MRNVKKPLLHAKKSYAGNFVRFSKIVRVSDSIPFAVICFVGVKNNWQKFVS